MLRNLSATLRSRACVAHDAQEEHRRENADSFKGLRQGYQPFVEAYGRSVDS